ncbi:MAG: hypothetical protein NT154_06330 [Verrucomicrobia bacterium]|nr:hypothetical protein [Verrucomicrobiota bacterium]
MRARFYPRSAEYRRARKNHILIISPVAGWEQLTNQLSLVGGSLRTTLDTTEPPQRFILAIENL